MLVPLALNYLDVTRYGIWLALSSLVGWFSFFDVGMGNGLRNKLSESLAKNEDEKARNYVSTAYFSLFLISLSSFFLFLFINYFLNWSAILNTNDVPNYELSLISSICIWFFLLKLVLQLLNNIIYAIQLPAFKDLIETTGKLLNLLIIFILIHTTKNSLLYLGISYSAAPVLIMFIASLLFFSKSFKKFRPSLKFFNINYFKDIFGLGGKFFIIQISAIVLYTTDNIIIAQLFSPKEITPYQIAHRYFGMVLMGFVIIVTPFWSAITEAFAKKEFNWIKKVD